MSVIAIAVRALIAAGVTGDALVTVIEDMENATMPLRTAHAARQARYRERHKASQSVTRDGGIESSSNNSEVKKERKKETISQSVTSDADRAYALSKGWTNEKIDSEFERFKNYAISNNRKYADWHRAWCNWVTSPYQQKGNRNGAGNGVMEAFDALIDRAGGEAVDAGPAIRDITPGRTETG